MALALTSITLLSYGNDLIMFTVLVLGLSLSLVLSLSLIQRLVHAQLCLDVCSVVPVLLQPCIAIAFLDAMLSWAPPPFDFAFWACWIPFGRAAAPESRALCRALCVALALHALGFGWVW